MSELYYEPKKRIKSYLSELKKIVKDGLLYDAFIDLYSADILKEIESIEDDSKLWIEEDQVYLDDFNLLINFKDECPFFACIASYDNIDRILDKQRKDLLEKQEKIDRLKLGAK